MASKPGLDALKAAYYRVHDSTPSQDQTAGRAGLRSQTQVSRLLRVGRDHRVLREAFRVPADLSLKARPERRTSFSRLSSHQRTVNSR